MFPNVTVTSQQQLCDITYKCSGHYRFHQITFTKKYFIQIHNKLGCHATPFPCTTSSYLADSASLRFLKFSSSTFLVWVCRTICQLSSSRTSETLNEDSAGSPY